MLFGASIITLLALLMYFIIIINVGIARVKYKVAAPAITGDPNFERVLRVQQNTLEQLVFFLPLLWLFSYYISDLWGSILGGVWVLGRVIYAWRYYQAAEKRTIGFAIGSLSSMILLVGTLIALAYSGIQSLAIF